MSPTRSDLGPELEGHLRGELGFATVEFHRRLGSTSDRAKELSAASVATPGIVVAEQQTAGRGRGQNRWAAAPGALTFSLLLDAPQTSTLAWASLGAAVAVAEALEKTARDLGSAVETQLKWPNDVLCAQRKLCGILLETTASRWIVGVGINVNNPVPPELAASAIALREVSRSRAKLDSATVRRGGPYPDAMADRTTKLCLPPGSLGAL